MNSPQQNAPLLPTSGVDTAPSCEEGLKDLQVKPADEGAGSGAELGAQAACSQSGVPSSVQSGAEPGAKGRAGQDGAPGAPALRWPQWAVQAARAPKLKPAALFQAFARWMAASEQARSVWEGQPRLKLSPNDHQKLVNALAEAIKSQGHATNPQVELQLRSWWDRLIHSGNSLKLWDIATLPMRAKIPPSKPVLVRHDMQLLAQLRDIEGAFWSWLAGAPTPEQDQQLGAAVLLSAMFCGQCASPSQLLAIARLRSHAVLINADDMQVILDVALSGRPQASKATYEQLWMPDCISAALIARWIKHTQRTNVMAQSGANETAQSGANETAQSGANVTAQPAATVVKAQGPVLYPVIEHHNKNADQQQATEQGADPGVKAAKKAAAPQTLERMAEKALEKTLEKTIEQALSDLGIGAMAGADLLRASRVAQTLNSPGYLVHYRCGNHLSHSMPASVMHRVFGYKPLPWRAPHLPPDSTHVPAHEPPDDQASAASAGSVHPLDVVRELKSLERHEFDPHAIASEQYNFMHNLLVKVNGAGQGVEDAQRLYEKAQHGLWPLTAFIANWIMWRRGMPVIKDEPTMTQKAIAGSSATRYVSAIWRHLLAVCGMENPLDLEVEELELRYEQGAARITSLQERAYYWRCVASFHTFLTFFGAGTIYLAELDGYVSDAGGPTPANLITESEFCEFKAQAQLARAGQLDCAATRVLLVGILGFRCGLRRREIQMAMTHHILLGREPWLLVRDSDLASLKSSSAKRRLPLYLLLPPDELLLLRQYVEMRQSKLGGAQGLLFCHTAQPMVALAQSLLFEPVTQCFQAIVGEQGPRFRFHFLRHSFANWTFLLLLSADSPELLDPPSRFARQCDITQKSALGLKDALFLRMPNASREVTAKNLYQLSYFLGHLSPQTTLKYYLHCLDWLGARQADSNLNARLGALPLNQLTHVCGLNESAARSQNYRRLRQDPNGFLRKFAQLQIPRTQRLEPTDTDRVPVDLSAIFSRLCDINVPSPTEMMLMLDAGRYLLALDKKSAPAEAPDRVPASFDRLERNYGVDKGLILELCKQYDQLFDAENASCSMPKPVEGQPHYQVARQEFWHILDASTLAYGSKSKRTHLSDAMSALMTRRLGPDSLNINFGADAGQTAEVVRGLISMGLPAHDLVLSLEPTGDYPAGPELLRVQKTCGKLGIVCTTLAPYTGEQRRRTEGRLKLSLSQREEPDHHGKAANTWSVREGRVRGLNLAALWIWLANKIAVTESLP